jgi:DNA-binding response OmpR family regulator
MGQVAEIYGELIIYSSATLNYVNYVFFSGGRMRKRRAVIFDDEPIVLKMLEMFLAKRGYEVFSSLEPVVCLVFSNNERNCHDDKPCADIMITDYKMPGMTGFELMKRQNEKGCGIDIRNKAIISGYFDDRDELNIGQLGCAFFRKPFRLEELATWINACEERMPLSKPVGIPRKERRQPVMINITYSLPSEQGTLRGFVTDLTSTGFCLKTSYNLSDKEFVVVNGDLPMSCRKAAIRWTRRLDEDNSFVAGVTCC